MNASGTASRAAWRRAWFVGLLAGAWALLAWGDGLASWALGLPAVVAAVALRARIPAFPPVSVDVAQALRFLGLFLARALSGGWDVARRALGRRVEIAPRMIAYRTALPAGLPRLVFAHSISLLPGSLTAGVDGEVLSVHLLDGSGDPWGPLRALERDVGRVFRVPIGEASDA